MRFAGFTRDLFFPQSAFEYWGRLNFMKVGIVFADLVSTVSPTYAREIQTPEFGFGLDGCLRDRASVLSGILNGTAGSVNGTSATDRSTNRIGPGSGLFTLGAPRQIQFGVRLTF